MPAMYARDPNTGTMVPVFGGGMTQAAADAKYLLAAGDTVTGSLTLPTPPNYASPQSDYEFAVATKDYVDNSMVGLVLPYAAATAPSGWLLCQGQVANRTTYKRLYDVIGTNYGIGDGSSTFNLPDLRGRVPVGVGTSTYFDAMNEKQGAKTVTLAKSQVPNFSGQWEMHNSAVRTMIYTVAGMIASNSQPGAYATGYENPGNPSIGGANLNMGFGGGAHSNLTWTFALQFIIRT